MVMLTLLYTLIVLLVIGFGILLFFVYKISSKQNTPQDDTATRLMMEWMKELKQDMHQSRESMQQNIHETNKQINERLTKAAEYIGDLKKEMGGISQIGPDIRRLSETLASPKMRGNFGEEMLEAMLAQVLPKSSYQTQYKFRNGEVVDTIIYVGEKILPIDSKFSMENFRLYKEAREESAAENLKKAFLKDVKKRVDEIYKKYILPQEGTFDFALMYIPSEGVFSEAIEDAGTLQYAREKKVYFVSPNTLYHHLQIILLSLKGQQVNAVAEQILRQVSGIKQESDKFGKNLDVLATHIKNAGNTMGVVHGDFNKLRSSIYTAADLQLEEAEILKELN